MNKTARCVDVIDFFWEGQRRERNREFDSIAGLALDKCGDIFQQRNCKEFTRWHAIYCRARSVSWRGHHYENDIVKSITSTHQAFQAPLSESRQPSQWRILDGRRTIGSKSAGNGVGEKVTFSLDV
jgi:hypothetical protein